jgi:tellurite resistance protein
MHKIEYVFELESNYGYYILIFSVIYFLLILLAYIIKIFINFDDVKTDFKHPVKSNFFPGI